MQVYIFCLAFEDPVSLDQGLVYGAVSLNYQGMMPMRKLAPYPVFAEGDKCVKVREVEPNFYVFAAAPLDSGFRKMVAIKFKIGKSLAYIHQLSPSLEVQVPKAALKFFGVLEIKFKDAIFYAGKVFPKDVEIKHVPPSQVSEDVRSKILTGLFKVLRGTVWFDTMRDSEWVVQEVTPLSNRALRKAKLIGRNFGRWYGVKPFFDLLFTKNVLLSDMANNWLSEYFSVFTFLDTLDEYGNYTYISFFPAPFYVPAVYGFEFSFRFFSNEILCRLVFGENDDALDAEEGDVYLKTSYKEWIKRLEVLIAKKYKKHWRVGFGLCAGANLFEYYMGYFYDHDPRLAHTYTGIYGGAGPVFVGGIEGTIWRFLKIDLETEYRFLFSKFFGCSRETVVGEGNPTVENVDFYTFSFKKIYSSEDMESADGAWFFTEEEAYNLRQDVQIIDRNPLIFRFEFSILFKLGLEF